MPYSGQKLVKQGRRRVRGGGEGWSEGLCRVIKQARWVICGSGFTRKHRPVRRKGVFCMIKGLLGSYTVRRPQDSGQRKQQKSWGKARVEKDLTLSYPGCASNPQLGVGLLRGAAPDLHPHVVTA